MRALTHGRTNIKKKREKDEPTNDKFCYWKEKAGIVERLNYTIKPNNTRDYGSRGALENRIRSRVFNQRRSVPLFGKSGGSTCGRTCVKKETDENNRIEERKKVNRVSKNGESGELIYWKSKLLVTKFK
jgi:hypothetical protein